MIKSGIAAVVGCVVLATACSAVDHREPYRTLAPVSCVDAVGENSKLRAMGDALVFTPYLRVRGAVRSQNEEEYYWTSGQPDDPLDPARVASYFSPGSRTALLYADAPPGGDAAFAESVCGREFDWKSGLSPEQFGVVMSTPGFVRGLGRSICSEIDRSEDRAEYFTRLDEELEDAEKRKDGMVEQLTKNYERSLADRVASVEGPIDPGDLPENRRTAKHDIIDLTEAIARLGKETDEHLVQVARDQVALVHAALDHQCPALKVR